MQQAIYNKIIGEITLTRNTAPKAATPAGSIRKRLARHIAHRWELWGILTLLGSCGTYGIYALAHVA